MTSEALLIDSSAWISSFRKSCRQDLKDFLINSIMSGIAVTTPVIILELLQGCRTENERNSLRSSLESLDVLRVVESVWERAYDLGFSLRRRALTIPTADLIIAAVAIENDCVILHQDKHFELIADHSKLRTKRFI